MYATRADMLKRFDELEIIQLTDRIGAGVIDDVKLDGVLADASAEIDSYLAARYSLPLVTVPALLVARCCDIARYLLWSDGASEAIRNRRSEAVAWLRDVARGTVDLGLPVSEAPTTSNLASINSDGRIFGRNGGGFL